MSSVDLGTLSAKIKLEGIEQAQSQLGGLGSKFGEVEQGGEKAKTGTDGFKSSITSALGNINVFGTSLGDVASKLTSSEGASAALGAAFGTMASMGATLAIQAIEQLGSACVDFIADSMELGASFEAQMDKVGALSGATADEMTLLTDSAREMAKTSVFSATEVAQAMEYTALAGYNTEQTLDALPGVLNLAASSGMDLAKASDAVTDNLTAFGLGAEDAGRMVDVMAYSMANSNTSADQLAEAYKGCASTATACGQSLEMTTTWLSKLADAGIKGGEAGTALNAILARMYGSNTQVADAMASLGVSTYDTTGKAKPLSQVMGEINKAMNGMTEEQKNLYMSQIAGTNHLSKFASMMTVATEDADEFTTSLLNCGGAAEDMVGKMNDNINGLKASVNSKVEDIKLSIFTAFEPVERGVLKTFEGLADGIGSLMKPIGGAIGELMEPIGALGSALGSLFSSLGSLLAPVVDLIGNTLVNVLDEVTEPLTWIFDTLSSAFDWLGEAIPALAGKVKDFFNDLIDKIPFLSDALDALGGFFTDTIGPALDTVKESVKGVWDEFSGFVSDAWDGFNEWLFESEEVVDANGEIANSYNTICEEVDNTTYLMASSFENAYDQITDKDNEMYAVLRGNIEEYKSEYDGFAKAIEDYEKKLLTEKMKIWDEENKDREDSLQKRLDREKYSQEQSKLIHQQCADGWKQIDDQALDHLKKDCNEADIVLNNVGKDANFDGIADKLKEAMDKARENTAFAVKDIQSMLDSLNTNNITAMQKKVGNWKNTDSIMFQNKGYANGTLSVPQSGVYTVGEFGPERVYLSAGSKVETRSQTAYSGGSGDTFNVSINASSVKEFNDVVDFCKNYRQSVRVMA